MILNNTTRRGIYKYVFNMIVTLFVVFLSFSIFMKVMFWLDRMPMLVWVIGMIVLYVWLCEAIHFFHKRMESKEQQEG